MDPTLTEKAYTQIRRMLSRGELKPGERLVNRVLADQIGMSFTPVREAINMLASEGLVEYVRGAGAYVRNINRTDLAQLFDLRANLEPYAAAEAAKYVSSNELAQFFKLSSRFNTLTHARRDVKTIEDEHALWLDWLDAEEAFHGMVFVAARNPWLQRVAGELRLTAMLFGPQRTGHGILTLSSAAWSWREHHTLVRRLAAGDSPGARTWMERHIEHGRMHVMQWFDQLEARE